MDSDLLKIKKQQIIERYGPWTAHNIHLAGDVYTIGAEVVGDEVKLQRVVQVVCDIARKPVGELRILDLACLEGLYAIEFARRGATVLGIEAREPSIEKARFVKDMLQLERLELVQDDVRHLSAGKYGHFDVVLCLGILYHLDARDVFPFLEQLAAVCRDFALIDTHTGSDETTYAHNGRTYHGSTYKEHDVDATPEVKAKQLWASLDNPFSFWPTKASLHDALSASGFTSVYECHVPYEPEKPADRTTLVAVKGRRERVICAPLLNAL